MAKTIALIGTFDTKGEEFSFLRDRIEKAGLRTILIDVGVLGNTAFEVDISQAEVAVAANEDLASLKSKKDRGRSVTAMALGATVILRRLFDQQFTGWLPLAVQPARQSPPQPCVHSQSVFQN